MYSFKPLLLLLPLLLAGCGSAEKRQEYQANLDALWAGKQLVAEQPITVPGGKSRVRYMGGSQVTKLKRFEPICQLEVSSYAPESREIRAGNYPVQSVNYRTNTRGGPSSRESNVARLLLVLQDSRGEVRTMVCWKESQGQVWRTPTLEQVNDILGPSPRFK